MPVLAMPVTTSQYLQVPQVLPHRRRSSRSRSKSRQRHPQPVVAVAPAEVVVSHSKRRPHSPPMPAAAEPPPPVKPAWKGFADGDRGMAPHAAAGGSADGLPDRPPVVEEQTGTNYDDLTEELYTPEPRRRTPTPPPPPPPKPLRQKLIGAWKLESYTAYPVPESPVQRPTHPMTRNVTGFIMYTPDGYMSAQMLIPGQQSFKRGEGEEPQWAEAGKRFFAYCGPYYISNEGPGREEILRHTFQVCNLPGWIGDIQIRTHRFEEDGQVLVLGSEEPTEIKGVKRIPVLKWRRVKDNSDACPPPPTPQIKISGPGEP